MKDIYEIMEEHQTQGADFFKRELRMVGFIEEEIEKIIKVVDRQPLGIFKLKNVTVISRDGVISVFDNSKKRDISKNYNVVLPKVDKNRIERYS